MTEPQSGKSFLSLLSQSGIVDADQLTPVLNQLAQQAGGQKIRLDQLTEHLIQSGLITKWHCEKLLAGKYKGFFLGKYKLLGHLGTGGMSSVYLADHTIFKQRRAIKVLPRRRVDDKTYLDRFYREGRAAAALNHPNIVRVYDIDNEADTHYLVMEYVEGTNLYDMVKQQGPLELDVTIHYMIQAATGLAHAHQNNLVHRDIKPANILVTRNSHIKLLDMGLAMFREEDNSLTMDHNEKVLGTADYLAPEQALNSHDVDHRADLYSFGCSIYYLLTGDPPFPTGTLAQRIAMHQHSEPAPLQQKRTDCPDDLATLTRRLMMKDPADRYQNCDQLINSLKRCLSNLQHSTGSATSPTHAPPVIRPTRSTSDAAGSRDSYPGPTGKSAAGKSAAGKSDRVARGPSPATDASAGSSSSGASSKSGSYGGDSRSGSAAAQSGTTQKMRRESANRRLHRATQTVEATNDPTDESDHDHSTHLAKPVGASRPRQAASTSHSKRRASASGRPADRTSPPATTLQTSHRAASAQTDTPAQGSRPAPKTPLTQRETQVPRASTPTQPRSRQTANAPTPKNDPPKLTRDADRRRTATDSSRTRPENPFPKVGSSGDKPAANVNADQLQALAKPTGRPLTVRRRKQKRALMSKANLIAFGSIIIMILLMLLIFILAVWWI